MVSRQFSAIDPEATGRQIAKLRKTKGHTAGDLKNRFGSKAPLAIHKRQKGIPLPGGSDLFALSSLRK